MSYITRYDGRVAFRRSSNDRLLLEPVSSSVPRRRIIKQRSQNRNRQVAQGGFIVCYFVPLPDNHCVQQNLLPVGGATVARTAIRSTKIVR